MEKPFDDLHVGMESQLLNSPEHIPDSAAVSAARKDGDTVDGLIALGKHCRGSFATARQFWHTRRH